MNYTIHNFDWKYYINENNGYAISTKSSVKISIVMLCYNNKKYTLETLRGFEKMYVGNYNFEVIIVDDNFNKENGLEDDIKQFSFPINLIVSSGEKKYRKNIRNVYNEIFSETIGDIIFIQNPECSHVDDILKHTIENLNERDFFSYGYFPENINGSISNINYCFSINKINLELIDVVDRDNGYIFEYLFLTVKYNLKMKIINHENLNYVKNSEIIFNATNEKEKWYLYQKIRNVHKRNSFIYPKLLFLYWDGSPLSYLNYLTVESFNEHNPEWKIIVYIPEKKTDILTWTTNEQKKKYTGSDHFYKLHKISNVKIKKVCLDKIGFLNKASEVIKSDYFRYYILEKFGGLWSDFDIMYTNSVEEKMNFEENTIIFHCTSYSCPGNKNSTISKYYPIGLFLTKPKSKLFKYILKNIYKYYDSKFYQCIGATMWNDLFKVYDDVYKINKNIKILDNSYYLPWQYNELKTIFYESNCKIPKNNIGIHWFNGGYISRIYVNNLDDKIKRNSLNDDCIIEKYINKYI